MKRPSPKSPLSSRAAAGLRIAVIAADFHTDISSKLIDGAVRFLHDHGASSRSITIHRVPGAFELPLAAEMAAHSKRFDAVVCLGAVIKGETPHFDFVSSSCAYGLQRVALHNRIPVAFGVLTTHTVRQALARAGGSHGNKGWDAAHTAVEMVHVLRRLKSR